jgi:ABC-type multidrug transport system fused ATPase/permease subunit
MKLFGEVWRLLDKSHQRQLPLLVLMSVLTAFSTLGGIAAVIPFFTVLADPQSIHHNVFLAWLYQHGGFHNERSFQTGLALGFIVTVLVANGVTYLGAIATMRFAYSVGSAFHRRLFHAYLHSDYAFHLRNDSATLTRNVLYEASRLSIGIVQNSLVLSANIVTIIVILSSVVVLNPLLAVAAIIGLGSTYLLIYILARRQMLRNGLIDSEKFAQRIRVVGESFGAIKEIITLRTQELFEYQFNRSCAAIAETAVSSFAISLAPKHILECLTVSGLAAIALFLSGRTADGGPWLAQVTFIGFAAYRLLPALQQVFVAAVRIRGDSPALANIAADLHRSRSTGRGGELLPCDPGWRGRPLREIDLHGVAFRYSAERPAAVCNLMMRIPAGAMVGFIGPNGSGKTTAADIVLGLLVPQLGSVSVDGILLDDANRHHWRSTLAYVPQQICLIDATVAENIAFGVPMVHIDQARMRRAAQMAKVDEFVEALPGKYQERVGERGIRLSGGQRQRIGIARALYREASLLVLDEATSALDGLIEEELVTTLEALRGSRTIILIAHRLSTVRNCDLLFEFESGHIAASGTYGQLLRGSERLRRMVDRVAG